MEVEEEEEEGDSLMPPSGTVGYCQPVSPPLPGRQTRPTTDVFRTFPEHPRESIMSDVRRSCSGIS